MDCSFSQGGIDSRNFFRLIEKTIRSAKQSENIGTKKDNEVMIEIIINCLSQLKIDRNLSNKSESII